MPPIMANMAPPILPPKLLSPKRVLPTAYVALIAMCSVYYMWPALFRSWFFSSDEYVIVAEVIRFCQFDFRQHFFDMPGTPLMFIAAVVWGLIYLGASTLGAAPPQAGIDEFTFQNLASLFELMRGLTLLFFVASVFLVYLLSSKLTNRIGGCVAATLLVTSEPYVQYSSFVRVESLAMCCFLGAVLCVLKAEHLPANTTEAGQSPRLDRRQISYLLAAGGLAGIAAATRLHSMMATLPLLLFLACFGRRQPSGQSLSLWGKRFWSVASIGALAGTGLLLTAVLWSRSPIRSILEIYPNASPFLAKLCIQIVGLVAVGWALYIMPFSRPVASRVAGERTAWLLSGFGTAFLIGTPTILWQFKFFFASIQTYTSAGYQDLDRIQLSLFENLQWLAKHYLVVIAPDPVRLLLLTTGFIAILIFRDRIGILFTVSLISFLVSRPIHLRAAPHHIILWLPQASVIAGFGAARVYTLATNRYPHKRSVVGAIAAILLVVLFAHLSPELASIRPTVTQQEERMQNISEATLWIKSHTEPNASILVSYFCFNSDIVYTWLRHQEVRVPPAVDDGREYLIWWGHDRALRGRAGYVVVTLGDVESIKVHLDSIEPGQGTDPFTDDSFRLVQDFGTGPNRVVIFRFDFRASETEKQSSTEAAVANPGD